MLRALPNTNLIFAKSLVPQLLGTIEAGTTLLVTAAMALPVGASVDAALGTAPSAPDLAALEALVARDGVDVSVILVPEQN